MKPSQPVRLYDLGPSPNSKKVRLALGYKEIAHEVIPVDPQARETIVEISGQPLTPVLLHGETIVYDSSAILRYLDANVRRDPRIFAPDRETMQAIERWEARAKSELMPAVGAMFGLFFSQGEDGVDQEAASAARRSMNEAVKTLESEIGESGYLVGDAPTAADFATAAAVGLTLLDDEAAKVHPIMEHFHRHFGLDPERERARAWYERINQYDRPVTE